MAAEPCALFCVGVHILDFQGVRSCLPKLVFSITFLKIMVEVLIFGLPQVFKLWFGVSKGMFSVKCLTPTISMAVYFCGRELAQVLGFVH